MSKSDYGQYIRKLRIDRGFSLRELACELDITPYYLSYRKWSEVLS